MVFGVYLPVAIYRSATLWYAKENQRKVKPMQEQPKQQHIPLKVYRTAERLMVAAPMPGLEPENILVEVTHDARLILMETSVPS